MAKSKKPPTLQQKYALEYASKLKEGANTGTEKSRKDQKEIGCTKVRIWSKTVNVIEWAVRNEFVVVEVNGEVMRYAYPFKMYNPFINFEVLEDCGYLDKFSNGEEYVIDGKRYGVKDDVVWAGGKRYLSSFEQVKFGSFRDFLAKHPEHTKRKTII